MGALEDDLDRIYRRGQRALSRQELAARRALIRLIEEARLAAYDTLLDLGQRMPEIRMQHVNLVISELDRHLADLTRGIADARLLNIDQSWQLGADVTRQLILAGGTLPPSAGLIAQVGHLDRAVLETLFGNMPQLAGAVTHSLRERIRNELVRGVALGESIPKLAKRIAGTGLTQEGLKRPFPSIRARATLIARTETIKAADQGYEALAERTEDVLPEELLEAWITAGDDRVEPECRRIARGEDGRWQSVEGMPGVYKRGHGPRPVISTHPGCRCRRIPVLRSWVNLGLLDLPQLRQKWGTGKRVA